MAFSFEGDTRAERCEHARIRAFEDAKSEGWKRCSIEEPLDKFDIFSTVCRVNVTCKWAPEFVKEFEEAIHLGIGQCKNVQEQMKLGYQTELLAKEEQFKAEKNQKFKRRRRREKIGAEERLARRRQRKIIHTAMAIQEMNRLLTSLTEGDREAIRLYHKGTLSAQTIKELMVEKISKGKEFNVSDSCLVGPDNPCVLRISTSKPFYKVVQLEISQKNPRSLDLRVCYGTLNPKKGDCVSRSDRDVLVSGQTQPHAISEVEILPRAEKYLALNDKVNGAGSFESYLNRHGIPNECQIREIRELADASDLVDKTAPVVTAEKKVSKARARFQGKGQGTIGQ